MTLLVPSAFMISKHCMAFMMFFYSFWHNGPYGPQEIIVRYMRAAYLAISLITVEKHHRRHDLNQRGICRDDDYVICCYPDGFSITHGYINSALGDEMWWFAIIRCRSNDTKSHSMPIWSLLDINLTNSPLGQNDDENTDDNSDRYVFPEVCSLEYNRWEVILGPGDKLLVRPMMASLAAHICG